MNILFVTEQFPYPLHDGGNLRTFHILRGLAREHEVHLIAHRPPLGTVIDGALFEDISSITTVNAPRFGSRLTNVFGKYGARGLPLFIAKNWSGPLLDAVRHHMTRHGADAIHFNHLDTACYAAFNDWTAFKVFDSHNCLSALAGQLAKEARTGLRHVIYATEAARLRTMEKRICDIVDVTLVCSNDDHVAFSSNGCDGEFTVVPNGVDTDSFQPGPPDVEEPGTLVFTGAMNYYPNEQAALFLCNEILPLIHETHPHLRIFLVGKTPTAKVRSLHNGRTVTVTGSVDDIRPFVHRAQVVIVPLKHGSGTRLKILEAFAMGKPVVSTNVGAEGIAAKDRAHLLLANDAPAFADRVNELVSSHDLRRRLGQAARNLVEREYDWRKIQRDVRAVYQTMSPRDASPLTSCLDGDSGANSSCP